MVTALVSMCPFKESSLQGTGCRLTANYVLFISIQRIHCIFLCFARGPWFFLSLLSKQFLSGALRWETESCCKGDKSGAHCTHCFLGSQLCHPLRHIVAQAAKLTLHAHATICCGGFFIHAIPSSLLVSQCSPEYSEKRPKSTWAMCSAFCHIFSISSTSIISTLAAFIILCP